MYFALYLKQIYNNLLEGRIYNIFGSSFTWNEAKMKINFEIIGIAKIWKRRFRNTNTDIGIAPQYLAIPDLHPCFWIGIPNEP